MSRRVGTVLMILVTACLMVLPSRGAQTGGEASPQLASSLPPLEKALWIWGAATNSTCELRRVFAATERPAAGTVLITADNGYELYVNGTLVGADVGAEGDVWQTVERYDVTSHLTPGRNVIGIRGTDLGGIRGVLAALAIKQRDGTVLEFPTDASWRVADDGEPVDYAHPEFVESMQWRDASVIGANGMAPWGKLAWSASAPARKTRSPHRVELAQPGSDFVWPEKIAFLTDDSSVYVPLRGDAWGVVFRVRDWSRAYTEFDLPCPSKTGRKLMMMQPAPGAKPTVLFDAGAGVIGSPSVSFDGESILVAMAREGEKFFHIYRIPASGGVPVRLTDGTFHDIDPAELPDGRIVFTSTRIGTFEEYHSPPSRALYVMNGDGSNIHPITHTLIFDNEPKVMANGRIVFIRSDNFFDRAKVETQLHSIRPDGTDGLTEVGAEIGADYGVRLRVLGYGSPAPLPDGRLAFISNRGNFVSSAGSAERRFHRLPDPLGDIAALPDGRLMVTVQRGIGRNTATDVIAVIDPFDNKLVAIHEQRGVLMHSPVYFGKTTRPPAIPDYTISPSLAAEEKPSASASGLTAEATGFLYCEDARITQKAKADWRNIKGIRVLGAVPLTVRSSHSHIVHVGHQTVELGTVPLAPDGSFFVEVPADTPLALQAVDAEGRSELNEMSWIYVRPGERRSCVGCHQTKESAPPVNRRHSLALRTAPVKLIGQGDPPKFRGNNPGVTGMMDLQFDRFRECASINLYENGHSAELSTRDEVAKLIAQLRGNGLRENGRGPSNDALKISAAQRLAVLRERSGAPALVQRLHEANREVRLAAAVALAACGTRDSVTGLLTALEDADPVVARAAMIALVNMVGGAIGDFDAYAPREARRHQAAEWRAWFARHDWSAIERTLIPRILSQNDPPRNAIIALGHIGGAAGAAALRHYVAQEASRNPYPRFERDNRTDTFTYAAESPWNPRTLQEAVRALGQLRDIDAVPLLAGILSSNLEPRTANLYLAEAAIEALGRIRSTKAEAALIEAFGKLKNYWDYVGWYSDHPALYACHSSPLHARVIEALERIGSQRAGVIVPAVIRSIPTDPDRALLPFNDSYETLAGRFIRRNGKGDEVIETCLALLGDTNAIVTPEIQLAIATTHPAWGGTPGPENRASQILSLACRDVRYEPRVRAAFERLRDRAEEPIKRELGNPTWTPVRHWALFYLARALGNLGDSRSTETLIAALDSKLNEARHGRPDPASPEIHFLHLDYTPCWRASAAWALGRMGDKQAVPVLIQAVENFDNAPDVRHTAAQALGMIADAASLPELKRLAASYPETSTRRVLAAACDAIAAKQRPAAVAQTAEPKSRL